ncbi:hypothetical protein [Cylindrospermopsis raciborskii]|jgi:hypothetical protein|nr:hypothetical protein [Cylindrospermopsis raciborskii]UJS03947.1 hypothetical protein L3I90_12625 [Cylindrospermopsis raciborskii KLL07]
MGAYIPRLKLIAIAILWTSGVITKDGKNSAVIEYQSRISNTSEWN